MTLLLTAWWLLVWIGFAVWGFRKKKGAIISLGGGFLVASIAWAVVYTPIAMSNKVDPLDALIPDAELENVCPGTHLIDLDRQTGKSVKGGVCYRAEVEVPHDIAREQVRPTLLKYIKDIKREHPNCEWIAVFLWPDKRLMGTGIAAGMAEYREGTISITYGIPSKQHLAECEALKKRVSDPALKGQKGSWGEDLYDPDYEPPKLMDIESFNQAVNVYTHYVQINELICEHDMQAAQQNGTWNADLSNKLERTQNARIHKKLAQTLHMSEPDVRQMKSRLVVYYLLGWGKETI